MYTFPPLKILITVTIPDLKYEGFKYVTSGLGTTLTPTFILEIFPMIPLYSSVPFRT